MTTRIRNTVALAALAAFALVLAPAAQAAGGFTAQTASKPKTTINCSSGTSCSVLIAKCVERDGKWNPKRFGPQGEPVSGSCTM